MDSNHDILWAIFLSVGDSFRKNDLCSLLYSDCELKSIPASRQLVEYTKNMPKNCRNSGWKYYNVSLRGARYGKCCLIPSIILHLDLGVTWSEFFGYTLQQEIKIVLQVLAIRNIQKFSCMKISFALAALLVVSINCKI
jgi:hypothetical protein